MVSKDMMEIELTEQDIVEGSKYRKKVKLNTDNPMYKGKVVSYRSLKGDEFAKIMEKMGMDDKPTAAENLRFLIEICKIPGVLTDGVAKMVSQLDQELIGQIAGAILGSSKGDEKKVKDFSEAHKEE